MDKAQTAFEGTWLMDGARRGQSFSHHASAYDHAENDAEPVGMRHAVVSQDGRDVGVWAPDHWSEEQIAEALNSNW